MQRHDRGDFNHLRARRRFDFDRFYNGDYYKGLDALAQKIVQAGVKRIEGNLIGDESYFRNRDSARMGMG